GRRKKDRRRVPTHPAGGNWQGRPAMIGCPDPGETMPRPAPFRLLAALALLALAAPAQAWTLGDEGRTFHAMPERIDWSRPGLQHRLDGRFGVVHSRDANGQSQTQPLAQLRYTVSL